MWTPVESGLTRDRGGGAALRGTCGRHRRARSRSRGTAPCRTHRRRHFRPHRRLCGRRRVSAGHVGKRRGGGAAKAAELGRRFRRSPTWRWSSPRSRCSRSARTGCAGGAADADVTLRPAGLLRRLAEAPRWLVGLAIIGAFLVDPLLDARSRTARTPLFANWKRSPTTRAWHSRAPMPATRRSSSSTSTSAACSARDAGRGRATSSRGSPSSSSIDTRRASSASTSSSPNAIPPVSRCSTIWPLAPSPTFPDRRPPRGDASAPGPRRPLRGCARRATGRARLRLSARTADRRYAAAAGIHGCRPGEGPHTDRTRGRLHREPSELQRAAAGGGHFDPVFDSDNVIRRVPLVKRYGDGFYPALAVSIVQIALEAKAVRPRFDDDGTLEALDLGGLWFRSRTTARRWCPIAVRSTRSATFRPPTSSPAPCGRRLRRCDRDCRDDGERPLRLRSTPVGPDFPGVEVHANLLAGMLNGELKSVPADAARIEGC